MNWITWNRTDDCGNDVQRHLNMSQVTQFSFFKNKNEDGLPTLVVTAGDRPLEKFSGKEAETLYGALMEYAYKKVV
jgi:hypothetical protein